MIIRSVCEQSKTFIHDRISLNTKGNGKPSLLYAIAKERNKMPTNISLPTRNGTGSSSEMSIVVKIKKNYIRN